MGRAKLLGHLQPLQPLGAAVKTAAQAEERRRSRSGKTPDRFERRLDLHELQELAADGALIFAVRRAANQPLIAQEPQAAGVIELNLDRRAQRLDDVGATGTEAGVLLLDLAEHALDVRDPRLARRVCRRRQQAARHRGVC